MLSADVIPDIDFGELLSNNGKFDEEFSQKIRKHGVVIIRNVFDREYTEKLYKGLSEYMRTNGEDPTVFGTTFFEIYWSKEQVLIFKLLHEYIRHCRNYGNLPSNSYHIRIRGFHNDPS